MDNFTLPQGTTDFVNEDIIEALHSIQYYAVLLTGNIEQIENMIQDTYDKTESTEGLIQDYERAIDDLCDNVSAHNYSIEECKLDEPLLTFVIDDEKTALVKKEYPVYKVINQM